jgi:hypothetical protein
VQWQPVPIVTVVYSLKNHDEGVTNVGGASYRVFVFFFNKFIEIHDSNNISASSAQANDCIVKNSLVDRFGPDDHVVAKELNNKRPKVWPLSSFIVGNPRNDECGYTKAKEVNETHQADEAFVSASEVKLVRINPVLEARLMLVVYPPLTSRDALVADILSFAFLPFALI